MPMLPSQLQKLEANGLILDNKFFGRPKVQVPLLQQ
jgi:hypothetical protein